MRGTSLVTLTLLFFYTAAMAAPAPSVSVEGSKKKRYARSRLTYDETESEADRRSLLLTTGEDRSVDLDFEPRGAGPDGISIGNPQLVATTLVKVGDRQQMVFKPLKSGETTVTVRDADGVMRLVFHVRVTGSNLLRVAQELRTLLRDIEGVEIRVVGNKVVLEGEILVPADYGRIVTVLQNDDYKKQVLNLSTLSPYAMQLLAKKIQEDINAFAPNVKTRVVNGFIFLEGSVDKEMDSKRALDIAYFYLPELKPNNPMEVDPNGVQRVPPRSLIKSFIVFNPPPAKKQEKLVRVTVHFVELSKDYNRGLGFKWEPGFSSNPEIQFGTTQSGGMGTSAFSLSGTISSLIPKLNSLQTAGYARILKTGTVVVRSGQPAKLNEQTEIPYLVQGNGQQTSASKGVGLVMAVTPQILGQSEDIQLDINMQQTNLVSLGKNNAAPITSNHQVETKLYIKSKESAAIAGVNSNDIGTDFNKGDPAAGSFEGSGSVQSQPFFSLMRSKAYRKKKSQFVIFVTPEIVESAADGTEDLKKNFRVKVR